MNKFTLLFVLLLVFLVASCDDDLIVSDCIDDFIARVDTSYIPDTVSVSDTLKFFLSGYLGGSSCFEFKEFETYVMENNIDITVWGRVYKCTMCLAVLTGYCEYYKLFPLQLGTYYIKIHKPNGVIKFDSVIVR